MKFQRLPVRSDGPRTHPAGSCFAAEKAGNFGFKRGDMPLLPAGSIHRRSSWVSSSRSRQPTNFSWVPIVPIRPVPPKAASWSSRKSSASIITSGRSATGSQAKATPRWRRRCSTVRKRTSNQATPDEIANARKFVANRDWGAMLRDAQAAIDELKKEGPVAIMGFCMGGTIAFLAACKLNGLSAAVCYYGGQIAKNADEKPKVPTQMHFGDKDAS